MPRLSACGGRESAFGDFRTAHARRKESDYIAMLVDSEDPVSDLDATWDHLKRRDHWKRPAGAADEQVLFMTTCMETWIVADRATLREHYGQQFQETALPPLDNLEGRNRHDVQANLVHASRNCANAYAKGKRSFVVLAELDPAVLEQHLPSFVRAVRILRERL
jgi:hypothetical protein